MKGNDNINWEEVEDKISLICYKFSNLRSWHEDLAQELRIHAYYVSDNYYDLYRKAIDFWRKIQTKQAPEIPYFDLEILGGTAPDKMDHLGELVSLIRKELTKTPPSNKWESKKMQLALFLLDVMLGDIDPSKQETHLDLNKSDLNHYHNNRLSLSWVAEETDYGYKQLVQAMKLLEDIIRGLHAMNKIEIPDEYFKGYYDE